MSLTKEKLICSICKPLNLRKNRSTEIVESLLEIMKRTLESGEDVLISGFGKWSVREKKERMGRNPQTGETMPLKARRVVGFTPSGNLRKRINGKT